MTGKQTQTQTPPAAGQSSEASHQPNALPLPAPINIGERHSKSTTCACFCCDTIEGQRQLGKGTYIPRLGSDESGNAPSRAMGEEEWARRFDEAVSQLATIAGDYRSHLPDRTQ